MTLLGSFVAAIAFSFGCGKLLRAHPGPFYIAAAAAMCAAAWLTLNPPASMLLRNLAFAVQKGQLAFSFFAIVMFVGCFPPGAFVRRRLGPIRGELSIIACMLIAGHIVHYAATLAPRVFGTHVDNVAVSFGVALATTVLLVVLGATSLRIVRRRMNRTLWKRIQRLAYPFFALAYVHLAVALVPSAAAGGATARGSLVVYTCVMVCYAVARVRRAMLDRAEGSPDGKDMERDGGSSRSMRITTNSNSTLS